MIICNSHIKDTLFKFESPFADDQRIVKVIFRIKWFNAETGIYSFMPLTKNVCLLAKKNYIMMPMPLLKIENYTRISNEQEARTHFKEDRSATDEDIKMVSKNIPVHLFVVSEIEKIKSKRDYIKLNNYFL